MSKDDTLQWMAAVSFWPILKSLSVDSNEKHVYFANYTTPLNVWRLDASTGSLMDAQSL